MSDIKKLLQKHEELNHLEGVKVVSHVQRNKDDWVINTIMLEGYDVPFKYKRKTAYKSLKGAQVNLTFYAETESVAGIAFEVMNVVRIRRA
jgi:L-ribulose-5-phosphate 3-epimerase UlaE